MKKNYSTPSFKVYSVKRANVIATSGPNQVQYGGSNSQGGPKSAEGSSRGSAIWD